MYSQHDYPHQPGAHPDWQESWVLVFRDPATNAVGFLRTGSYVNQGTTQTHWGMALPDGTRFRRHLLNRKLEPGDRTESSASSGTLRYSIVNGEYCRFEAWDKDAEADLRFYSFFPAQDWALVGGDHHGVLLASDNDHGHPETGGRVEGRVRIGERVIEIKNGIGYRDHGYGPRPHSIFRAARWHGGTVGEQLSYSLLTMQGATGPVQKMGWIARNGVRQTLRDFHTINCSLADGYSSLGGWSVVLLESGERIRIDVETIDCVVTSTHLNNGGPGSSPAGVEALSIPRWNGFEGVCDFNMIDNAHGGEQAIVCPVMANHEDGLSRRDFDPSWLR